jgi:hypothetical protein
MQLYFVSVHGPRETYFVDEPRKIRVPKCTSLTFTSGEPRDTERRVSLVTLGMRTTVMSARRFKQTEKLGVAVVVFMFWRYVVRISIVASISLTDIVLGFIQSFLSETVL